MNKFNLFGEFMKNKWNLEIDGFGLINNAKIEINKINVVGGVNSSGKSTASKLLYCFLKSMSLNRKDYIFEDILPKINQFINYMEHPREYLDVEPNNKYNLDDDFHEILENYFDAEDKYEIFHDYFSLNEILDDLENYINKLIPLLLDKNQMGYSAIDNYISKNEFYEDTFNYDNSFYVKGNSAVLQSLFKNESLLGFDGKSSFYNDKFKCSVSYEYTEDHFGMLERYLDLVTKEGLSKEDFDDFDDSFIYFTDGSFEFINDVSYIDSISIFDLNHYLNKDEKIKKYFGYKEHIDYLLKQIQNTEYQPNLSDEAIEQINKSLKFISNIIGGETFWACDENFHNEDFYFFPNNSKNRFNVHISSGIQQISIIQILLHNHILYPGCYLIIDEPEVNLHPEWQFKFAEILVLLAKELDITIYLNSHSPFFIEAIDAFTEFYDMQDEVNYYLTEESEVEGKYDFTKIPSNKLSKIYENLGNPYDLIDQLRLKKRFGE